MNKDGRAVDRPAPPFSPDDEAAWRDVANTTNSLFGLAMRRLFGMLDAARAMLLTAGIEVNTARTERDVAETAQHVARRQLDTVTSGTSQLLQDIALLATEAGVRWGGHEPSAPVQAMARALDEERTDRRRTQEMCDGLMVAEMRTTDALEATRAELKAAQDNLAADAPCAEEFAELYLAATRVCLARLPFFVAVEIESLRERLMAVNDRLEAPSEEEPEEPTRFSELLARLKGSAIETLGHVQAELVAERQRTWEAWERWDAWHAAAEGLARYFWWRHRELQGCRKEMRRIDRLTAGERVELTQLRDELSRAVHGLLALNGALVAAEGLRRPHDHDARMHGAPNDYIVPGSAGSRPCGCQRCYDWDLWRQARDAAREIIPAQVTAESFGCVG